MPDIVEFSWSVISCMHPQNVYATRVIIHETWTENLTYRRRGIDCAWWLTCNIIDVSMNGNPSKKTSLLRHDRIDALTSCHWVWCAFAAPRG
jgi:hypothetical protein